MMNQTGKMIDCTILVLTYKGKKHLEYLLPTIEKVIEESKNYRVEVQIVDNGCCEETRTFSETNFPDFQYHFSPANDYLFSLNAFVKKLSSPFVFILNDDMKLKEDVLHHTLPIIQNDEQLFSVGCNILDWEGLEETIGVRVMDYKRGWLESKFVEFKDEQLRYTLYGGGGAAVFRVSYFNELEGFNDLFRPAYGEDLDLGHRAWHRAWPSVVNPKAILYHREGGTIHDQFASDELEQKVRKNNILWMLRNCNQKGFLFFFFLLLPLRFLKWRKLHWNLYIALKLSFPYFGKAIRQRIIASKSQLKDVEIDKLLNKVYEIRE
jgi:GT2 family glycosyltransferase